jgi:hypothetical protein
VLLLSSAGESFRSACRGDGFGEADDCLELGVLVGDELPIVCGFDQGCPAELANVADRPTAARPVATCTAGALRSSAPVPVACSLVEVTDERRWAEPELLA